MRKKFLLIMLISFSIPQVTYAATLIDIIAGNPIATAIMSAIACMVGLVILGTFGEWIAKLFRKGEVAEYINLAIRVGCLGMIAGIIVTTVMPIVTKLYS